MVNLRDEYVQEYNLLSCIQCGRCAAGCPISSLSKLNTRILIYNILVGENPSTLAEKAELWDCTTCSTCAKVCPKNIQPFDLLIGMRSIMVERGKVSSTVRDALEGIFKYGNPYGRSREKRALWSQDLHVRRLSQGEKIDLLVFVGCAASYDPRAQDSVKAFALILKSIGADFATLGNNETCCGNEVRRMGEEGLFEMLVEDNTALFSQYTYNTMITISPHCYNVFFNEYPGSTRPILHYTQLLEQFITEEKLSFAKKYEKKVTYHDPCFLGKQNRIYEEPRKILNRIPGLIFKEFDRAKERSLCCEGGGGRMWQEGTVTEDRNAEKRIHDALEMDVQIIATACPFCLLTLEDAVKTTGNDGKIQVLDIAEIVAEAMGVKEINKANVNESSEV